MNALRSAGLMVVAGLVLGATAFFWPPTKPVPDIQGAVLPSPKPLPDFLLIDHTGQPVSADVFAGQWHLVSYGFTHCPDVCPTLLSDLAQFNKSLQREKRFKDLQVWFYTVDPLRDNTAALANYVPWFDKSFVGIRAPDREAARRFERSLGIQASVSGSPENDYQISHGFRLFLLDDEGRLRAALEPTRTREGQQFFESPVLLKDYLALRDWVAGLPE